MKNPIRLLLFFAVIQCALAISAAAQPVAISKEAYKQAIEDELTKYGGSRYLYEQADAYQRLIQYRALKRLGYDLAQESGVMPLGAEDPLSDTTKDITSTSSSDQNETTIAISRSNPNVIVAGANDVPGMLSSGMPAYYSLDAGNKWQTARVPRFSTYTVLGDPAIVAADSGYFYYAYLTGPNDRTGEDNLIVASSKDGKKWTNGGIVIPIDSMSGFEDKENICVDNNPTSPYYGRVYLVWLHFNGNTSGDGGSGMITWSDDRCKTWSTPVDVMDNLIRFSEVRVGKHGEVFFTFSLVDAIAGTGSHFFLTSTDGGASFQTTSFTDFVSYPLNQTNYPGLKGYTGFRAFPYIAHDVDLQTNQIHLVYGSWFDDGSGVNAPAAALYYISSTDLGVTWTQPLPIGISNPAFSTLDHDRFCPWVTVNQKTGDAYCSYYSSERDTNDLLIAAFRTKLSSDLKDFPTPLEKNDFDPSNLTKTQSVPFVGDYEGCDSYDSVFAAAWTQGFNDARTDGDVYVYIQTPNLPTGSTGVPVVIKSDNLWLSAPSPNPLSGGMITFSYYLPHDAIAEIALYSIAGIKVKTFSGEKLETGTYTKEYNLSDQPSGVYILRLSTPYGNAEKNIVITK